MDAGRSLRAARRRAGLTQADLARRTGTSQTAVSAYENARKQPSVATLTRLLDATGSRLTAEPSVRHVIEPSAADFERASRTLTDVLDLAGALPARHEPELAYPPLARMIAEE